MKNFINENPVPENRYNTDSPLILYNTEYKSGGVQKLSEAVFCTPGSGKTDGTVSNQWRIGIKYFHFVFFLAQKLL